MTTTVLIRISILHPLLAISNWLISTSLANAEFLHAFFTLFQAYSSCSSCSSLAPGRTLALA